MPPDPRGWSEAVATISDPATASTQGNLFGYSISESGCNGRFQSDAVAGLQKRATNSSLQSQTAPAKTPPRPSAHAGERGVESLLHEVTAEDGY